MIMTSLQLKKDGEVMMIFIGGKNLALSVLCSIIPPVGLLLFTYKSIQPNRKI